MNSKRVWRLWLEINDKDLFKALGVCKPETHLSDTQSVLRKEEKLRVLTVKSTFVRRISPEFLASGLF